MRRIKHLAVAAIFGAALASPSAMANLVSDPGFELDDASWTVSGWAIANYGRGAHSGVNAVATGCVVPDLTACTFSQTLATTPGALYDVSFWLYADGLSDGTFTLPNGLQVSFDGVVVHTILDFPSTNPSATDFVPGGASTLITINDVLASTSSTVLEFGGFDDPAFIFVDDVSVNPVAVPEPVSLALLGLGLAGLGFSRRKQA